MLLRDAGMGAFGAGRSPTGEVHPLAPKPLKQRGFQTTGPRPESSNEFAAPGAPAMDVVFTVRDHAAGEVWPGQPMHWGTPDPAIDGSEAEQGLACRAPEPRIGIFTSPPVAALDRIALTRRVEATGRPRPDAPEDDGS
jgi:arsenate reductase (thioredoxin)